MDISTQAVKKGASQTVIGLIFGCYAICNLIGSLILGKYVSILHYSLSCHTKCYLLHKNFLYLCHCVRLFKSVPSSCLSQGFLCHQAALLCLGKCRSCVPLYIRNDDHDCHRNISATVISWLIKWSSHTCFFSFFVKLLKTLFENPMLKIREAIAAKMWFAQLNVGCFF